MDNTKDIYTNDLPCDDPKAYCRLCLSSRNLVPIFPKESEPEDLYSEQIYELTGIEIIPETEAVSVICWRCAVALEDFQRFKQRSLQSDSLIRKKVEQTRRDERKHVKEKLKKVHLPPTVKEKPTVEVPESIPMVQVEANLIREYADKAESSSRENVQNEMSGRCLACPGLDGTEQKCSCKPFRKYICHLCSIEFTSQSTLYVHFVEQHSDHGRPFQCTSCPATFKRKHHLEDHMSSHTGKKKYVCKECGMSFARPKQLSRHRMLFHPATSASMAKDKSDGLFRCNHCPKVFKHRPSLNFHVKAHFDKLAYACDICNARFMNKQGVLVHKGKFHAGVATSTDSEDVQPDPKEAIKCPECPRAFPQQRYLTMHMKFMHTKTCADKPGDVEEDSKQQIDHSQKDDDSQPITIKFEVEDTAYPEYS